MDSALARLRSPRLLATAALAAIALAGFALRLDRAWDSVETLVLRTTPDDAYYYFQIARNIADGRNVAFDGEHLTNGFHPLWLLVITPIFALTDDRELAVHLSLSLAALFGTVTIVVLGVTIQRLTGNAAAALVAAGFYALHPYVVAETVNGVETALTVMLLSVAVWMFVRMAMAEPGPGRRDYVLLGVALGLMVLARTDTVFLVPFVLGYLAWKSRHGKSRWQGAASAVAAFGVVLPWLVWTLVTFGTVVQVSGLAGPELEWQRFLAEHGDALTTQARQSLDYTRSALTERLPHLYFVPRGEVAPFALAGSAWIAVMVLAPLRTRGATRRQLVLLAVPTAGVIASLLYHTGIRWHAREWYFGPTAFASTLFLGVMVAHAEGVARAGLDRMAALGAGTSWRWVRRLALPARYVSVATALVGVYTPQRRTAWDLPVPYRLNMLETARWLSSNTEPDARMGSFNAGIIGYYSERQVVNLDGVVNEGAYRALRDCRTSAYIREERLEYVVDFQTALVLAHCGAADAGVSYEHVVTLGTPISINDAGQLDVLRVITEP